MKSTYIEIGKKIFFSERLPKIEDNYQYINSINYQIDRYDKYLRISKDEIITNQDVSSTDIKQYIKNVNLLGPYEITLIRSILFPINQITVILGALGSGKTSSLQYINELISKSGHGEFKFNIIFIDFNDCTIEDIQSDSEKKSNLLNFLTDKIEAYILNDFYIDFDKLWENAIKISRKENIDIIIKTDARLGNLSGDSEFVKKKVTNYIDQNYKYDLRYKFWISLLYIYDELTKNIKFRIFLDNVDHLGSYLQNEILNSLLHFSNSFPAIKFYVTMRIISFRNLWGNLDKGVIPHSSIIPIYLIKERLLLFLKLINNLKTWEKLTNKNKIDLLIRIAEIIYFLNNPNSELFRFISSISGFSIKRALKISVNLFNNLSNDDRKIVYFSNLNNATLKNNKKITDELINHINSFSEFNIKKIEEIILKDIFHIIKNNVFESYIENKRDRDYCELLLQNFHLQDDYIYTYIENVYCFAEGELTTIKLRILFYLSEKKKPTSIRNLLSYLKHFNFDPDELIQAINSLSSKDRRLIWFDGNLKFKNMDELYRFRSSNISLTKTGKEYREYLLFHPIFIENMIIYNKIDKSFNRLIDRLNILFDLSFSLVDIEIQELNTAITSFKRKYDFRRKYKYIITQRIFCEFWIYLLEILSKHVKNVEENIYLSTFESNKHDIQILANKIETNFYSIQKHCKSLFGDTGDLSHMIKCSNKIRKLLSTIS